MSGSTDERRERYMTLFRSAPGEERLGDTTPGEIADAVMAVADAEIATLLAQLASDQLRGEVAYDRAVAAERENARLRAELRAALVLDGRAENTKEG